MEKYLNEIINNNQELENSEIVKINIGFTNLVYSADDKYIIKICNNKENEERFKNEIDFYLKNRENKYIPKLYNYHKSTNENDYSYEILEKVKGQSLYFVWHTFTEEERKEYVRDISFMMKSFHSIKGDNYDWASFMMEKLNRDFINCNEFNLFNIEEKEKIGKVIKNISSYLETSDFRLVHSDIHFDNILLDKENNLKIIDFETAIYAPIDYELDIFLRMCINPLKYSSEETEKFIKIEDYKNIPNYLKEFYSEIFNGEYFEIRHLIYDLEANFRLLARFPKDIELKEIVLNIIEKILMYI